MEVRSIERSPCLVECPLNLHCCPISLILASSHTINRLASRVGRLSVLSRDWPNQPVIRLMRRFHLHPHPCRLVPSSYQTIMHYHGRGTQATVYKTVVWPATIRLRTERPWKAHESFGKQLKERL